LSSQAAHSHKDPIKGSLCNDKHAITLYVSFVHSFSLPLLHLLSLTQFLLLPWAAEVARQFNCFACESWRHQPCREVINQKQSCRQSKWKPHWEEAKYLTMNFKTFNITCSVKQLKFPVVWVVCKVSHEYYLLFWKIKMLVQTSIFGRTIRPTFTFTGKSCIFSDWLHRPIILLHKNSVYCQEPWVFILFAVICFLDSQSVGSLWPAFYESSFIFLLKGVVYCFFFPLHDYVYGVQYNMCSWVF